MYKQFFSSDLLPAAGFFQRSAACHHRPEWVAKYKISIHMGNFEFVENCNFEKTNRKCGSSTY
jgi:hypothetical protein